MNHPTQNEWLLYLDGEASPEAEKRLLEHLDQCPLCATEFAGWERSVQKLQRIPFPASWQARPDQRAQRLFLSSSIKWGLAAAIILLLGFAAGRVSVARGGALEREVTVQVRNDLRAEMREDLLTALDPVRPVKNDFQKQLQEQIRLTNARNARWYDDVIQTLQRQRQEDQQHVLTLVSDVQAQHLSDYLALRRDLETAVSTADHDLRQNSRNINELAVSLLNTKE